MFSGFLYDLMLLTLPVWPLAQNMHRMPETSRPYTARPGLLALTLSEHVCVLYVCVCVTTSVWVCCDSEAYHLALPPKAWQNRVQWWWLRCAFPPSQASTRDSGLALCKQKTCAHSALSAATVMRVTLSSLYTQHAGHLNHAGRAAWRQKNKTTTHTMLESSSGDQAAWKEEPLLIPLLFFHPLR